METVGTFRILPGGDSCIIVDFGSVISLEVNAKVQALKNELESKHFQNIRELVPTYRSLTIYFDPLFMDLEKFIARLNKIIPNMGPPDKDSCRTAMIPVCYGGEFGPDLGKVASRNGLTCDDVIRIHSSKGYYCYMLGFTPGFPYLGGMDESISAPRLETPREIIPAGSVGIAGEQTGIYPIASPGGWQLIGRTPLKLFDPHRDIPVLLEAGIWIRFQPISEEEYGLITEKINSGNWELTILEGGQA